MNIPLLSTFANIEAYSCVDIHLHKLTNDHPPTNITVYVGCWNCNIYQKITFLRDVKGIVPPAAFSWSVRIFCSNPYPQQSDQVLSFLFWKQRLFFSDVTMPLGLNSELMLHFILSINFLCMPLKKAKFFSPRLIEQRRWASVRIRPCLTYHYSPCSGTLGRRLPVNRRSTIVNRNDNNIEMPRTSHLPLLPSTRKRPFIPVYPLEHLYDLRQHAETLFYNVLYVYQRYSIVYFF